MKDEINALLEMEVNISASGLSSPAYRQAGLAPSARRENLYLIKKDSNFSIQIPLFL